LLDLRLRRSGRGHRCADERYLYIHTGAKGSFERLCRLIGCKAEDFPGYYPAHFVGDPEQGHRFRMLLIDAFMARPMAEIAAELQRHEVALGPCLKPAEILRHEQAAANQLALDLDRMVPSERSRALALR
jgi:crotonobetainyl-CoA:carnitine CoA-transferase CaiB-like acyl-CoA transferase